MRARETDTEKNLIEKILEKASKHTPSNRQFSRGARQKPASSFFFYVTPLHSSDQNQEDFVWLATVREFHGS